MMHGVLADAGPLYAAADESDAHHQRAHRESQALENSRRQIVIAYRTFLETHALVLARMGPRTASLWLSYMSDAMLINPSLDDYQQALMRVRALPDQRITLFDATVAVMAANLGLEVWTYDHHFDVMRVPVWLT